MTSNSFDEMHGFLNECRKHRTFTLKKLAHVREWTIDGFPDRANSREVLEKAVNQLTNELKEDMKWIEKGHGGHFAAVKEQVEGRNDQKHSTVHALINAVSNLQESIDEGNSALGIFVHFSKAFDTVNHTILLHKLENDGIRGTVHKLLSSY
jgi:uncharacterized surface protein with fasciclin (FAS1) repeats